MVYTIKRMAVRAPIVALLAMVLPLPAQTPNFAARRDYFAGGLPLIVGVGDFNNDGIPDIITNTACIFFGNGDGTFRPGPCIPGTPFGVAIADFDGDGNLDLAEVDGVDSDVFIYYGNGDGTFAAAVSLPLNFGGSAVAAADLNGDGRPDLVVGTGGVGLSSAGGVSVILNLGNGNSASPTVYLSPDHYLRCFGENTAAPLSFSAIPLSTSNRKTTDNRILQDVHVRDSRARRSLAFPSAPPALSAVSLYTGLCRRSPWRTRKCKSQVKCKC